VIQVSGLTVRFGGVTPLDGMDVKFDAGRMTVTPAGQMIAFHEEVRPAAGNGAPVPVLVSQNFYRILPDLVDDNDENEFTLHAWEPIFFRALTEATKYLIEDPRTSLWEQKAIATENRLVLEHSRATHAGGRLVIEEPG